MTTECAVKPQGGFTLINMMIGLFLITLLTAGALSLLSQARTGVGNNMAEQRIMELNRVLTQTSMLIERAGIVSNGVADDAAPIQVCSLLAGSDQCQRFKPQPQKGFCVMAPVQNEALGYHAVEYYGVRLKNGVLEERPLAALPVGQTQISTFCKNNSAWAPLHTTATFKVEQISLCSLPRDSFDSMMVDFSQPQNCSSILDNSNTPVDENPGFWIMVFNFAPFKRGESGVTMTRVLQLFNHPKVVTL